MQTPEDHIGINIAGGLLYGYEHAAPETLSSGVPDYPNPGTIDEPYFLLSVLRDVPDAPIHRDVFVAPPHVLDDLVHDELMISSAAYIEAVEPVTEEMALEALRHFESHSADSLRELADQTEPEPDGCEPVIVELS